MATSVEPVTPFDVGRTYRRRDLHALYGGQQQGGISTPKDRHCLLLFTGLGGRHGGQDGLDEHGVFRYSGGARLCVVEAGPGPGN